MARFVDRSPTIVVVGARRDEALLGVGQPAVGEELEADLGAGGLEALGQEEGLGPVGRARRRSRSARSAAAKASGSGLAVSTTRGRSSTTTIEATPPSGRSSRRSTASALAASRRVGSPSRAAIEPDASMMKTVCSASGASVTRDRVGDGEGEQGDGEQLEEQQHRRVAAAATGGPRDTGWATLAPQVGRARPSRCSRRGRRMCSSSDRDGQGEQPERRRVGERHTSSDGTAPPPRQRAEAGAARGRRRRGRGRRRRPRARARAATSSTHAAAAALVGARAARGRGDTATTSPVSPSTRSRSPARSGWSSSRSSTWTTSDVAAPRRQARSSPSPHSGVSRSDRTTVRPARAAAGPSRSVDGVGEAGVAVGLERRRGGRTGRGRRGGP